jgi:hypothetical protein
MSTEQSKNQVDEKSQNNMGTQQWQQTCDTSRGHGRGLRSQIVDASTSVLNRGRGSRSASAPPSYNADSYSSQGYYDNGYYYTSATSGNTALLGGIGYERNVGYSQGYAQGYAEASSNSFGARGCCGRRRGRRHGCSCSGGHKRHGLISGFISELVSDHGNQKSDSNKGRLRRSP